MSRHPRSLLPVLTALLVTLVAAGRAPASTAASNTASHARLSFGALDHSIVYDDGNQVVLAPYSGTGLVGLANLSPSPSAFKRPRYAGWQFMYYDNGFRLGDIFGHRKPVTPPLASGEDVYDAWPSPDGQYIAWQLVISGTVEGITVNVASSRIVLTDQSGGNPRVLLQQAAGPTYGDIPIIYGWRPGNPTTLLVQTSYGTSSMFGLHKGLQEYDPRVLDMVGDYLPPVGEGTLPTGEVLDVSPSGQTLVYATRDVSLPSGEGQLPAALSVMRMNTRQVTALDVASRHRDKATPHLPVPRTYVFSREAFISPDDSRVAYTRLDVIYPNGVTTPFIRPIACLANLDGSGEIDFGPGERVMGWQDNHTVVVRREHSTADGLYTVNLTTGVATPIVLGQNMRVDGIVP